jgi:hypothetical protein
MILMYFILYLWEQRHTIEWWKFYRYQMNAFRSTTETTALRGGNYDSPAGMSNQYATSPELMNFGTGLHSNNDLSSMNRNNGFGELQSPGMIGNHNNNGGARVSISNDGFGVTSGASNSGFKSTNSMVYATNTNNGNVMKTSNMQQKQQMPAQRYKNVGATDLSMSRDYDVQNSQSTRSLSNNNNIRSNQLSQHSSKNMEQGQVLTNVRNTNNRFAGSDGSRQLPPTITSASVQGQLESVRKQIQAYQPQSNHVEIVSI